MKFDDLIRPIAGCNDERTNSAPSVLRPGLSLALDEAAFAGAFRFLKRLK
jgi:hypothetical protein